MSTSNEISWGRKTKDSKKQQMLKRRVLLDAAARSFTTKGYMRTSLDDLARTVDVSRPALYYYVKNKEDILLQCVGLSLEMIQEALAEVGQPELNGLEQLKFFFIKYAGIVVSDYGYALIREGNKYLSEESQKEIRNRMREGQSALSAITELGIADGSIAPCEPGQVANLLFSTFNQMAFWYKPEGPASPQELAEQLLNLAVNGLAPRD